MKRERQREINRMDSCKEIDRRGENEILFDISIKELNDFEKRKRLGSREQVRNS